MAATSTIGTRRGYVSIIPSLVTSGFPAWTRLMSALVPPTSIVMMSVRPASSPAYLPPMTPAAGPDSRTDTGLLVTRPAEVMPPRDCMTCSGASMPALRSSALKSATYC